MRWLGTCIAALCVATAVAVPEPSAGEEFPQRPVRIITGNPGATADVLARQLARRLTERWGQQAIVDNRGGAGATLSAEAAMRALPDGYTLLLGQQNSHALAPGMRKVMPYDPVRDFAPITRVASAPQVLLTRSSAAAANWKQFAEFAKTHPGKASYASSGHGTVSHLTAELLKQRASLDILHVNYKGGAAASLALVSGEATVAFVPLATAWPLLQAGKVKALGISSINRFPTLPEVATLHESGLPGFEASSWFGVFAPARIPRALVARLNRDLTDVLRSSATQQAFLQLGAEATSSTPEEFTAFVASEVIKWRKVISDAGISPQ